VLFDKPDPGALTVLPPAIGASPDDIHGVDDPPHNADGTDAHRWQYESVDSQARNNVRIAGAEDGPTIMLALRRRYWTASAQVWRMTPPCWP
jgi:hypothetical protein